LFINTRTYFYAQFHSSYTARKEKETFERDKEEKMPESKQFFEDSLEKLEKNKGLERNY